MSWPWSKHEPDRIEREIAQQKVEHQNTLRRVGRVLAEATDEIKRTGQLMDDYTLAERHRGKE